MSNGLKKWFGKPNVNTLQEEMNRTFDRFFREWDSPFYLSEALTPLVDISETEDKITVKAELPGVEPKDVNITIHDNTLVIKGEKKEEKEAKGENYHRVECSYGSFSRALDLPSTVDADKVTAEYKKGVLVITLQKKEEAKPKQISVKVS